MIDNTADKIFKSTESEIWFPLGPRTRATWSLGTSIWSEIRTDPIIDLRGIKI